MKKINLFIIVCWIAILSFIYFKLWIERPLNTHYLINEITTSKVDSIVNKSFFPYYIYDYYIGGKYRLTLNINTGQQYRSEPSVDFFIHNKSGKLIMVNSKLDIWDRDQKKLIKYCIKNIGQFKYN